MSKRNSDSLNFEGSNFYKELISICPGGVEFNVSLKDISRWRVGGIAKCIVRPSSTVELAKVVKLFSEYKSHYIAVGETSNVLFSDDGLNIPCIQISRKMSNVEVEGCKVIAQAGAWVPLLARIAMQNSLTGAEHLCGIPGSLGGLLCMNGGSQRKGIGSSVLMVESVNNFGEIKRRTSAECGFSYRTSIFQVNGEIVTSASMVFRPNCKSSIRKEMLYILSQRSKKFPRKLPNCGSVFKSDPAMYDVIGPPGEVIEKLGYKGFRVGGAEVSKLHSNFIVNVGEATANDIKSIISEISRKVEATYGFKMSPEVKYIDAQGVFSSPDIL